MYIQMYIQMYAQTCGQTYGQMCVRGFATDDSAGPTGQIGRPNARAAASESRPLHAEASLEALEARVRRELELTRHPAADWMPSRPGPGGAHLYDVIVAGAGQGGLATAFQLRRECVPNILVIDKAPYGGEGVWVTYARMPTLRTPKHYNGPDLRVPSLTYQAWHEARFGARDWQELDYIPTRLWADYLIWYRRVLELPVRNDCALTGIAPDTGCLRLTVDTPAGTETLHARKLVLATGQEGLGRWLMPDYVEALPPRFRAGTADAIDFAALKDKVVAVLGAGASAADNAACALEAGAASVHMFVRRPAMQRVQPYRWLTFPGFLRHLGELPDDWRWRFMNHILSMRESFQQQTYDRLRRHDNFHIHVGAGWRDAAIVDGRIRIDTAKGPFMADFIVSGAGIDIAPALKPELAPFAEEILTWGDRYTPPPEEANPRLARYPYHGPDGELLERHPGRAPFLRDIHDFTIANTMSFGPAGASINAMNIAVPRLVAGLTRGLFRADLGHHWQSLRDYDTPIFEPAEIDRDKV